MTVFSVIFLMLANGSPVSSELGISLEGGVPSLRSDGNPVPSIVMDLQYSVNLDDWASIARIHDALLPYPDAARLSFDSGFYRLLSRSTEVEDDWTNQLNLPGEAFFEHPDAAGLAAAPFAKFTLVLAEPDRVYFQDTSIWPYHYQWARSRLEGFTGISLFGYDAIALHPGPEQQLVVGSVIRSPDPQVREVGIELTATEVFPVELVADCFDAVVQRLAGRDGWRVFYMPAYSQLPGAQDGAAYLFERGIVVDSPARWVTDHVGYSPGWALGKLVYVPGSGIAASMADGTLSFGDILVTDHVPAEIPVLAGVLAFEPATPNSHAAILARSVGIPFAHVSGQGLLDEILGRLETEVLLVVTENPDGSCEIAITPTADKLTESERQEILASKRPALSVVPKQSAGHISLGTDLLTPDDIVYAGGKAANFGFLRRAVPEHSPDPAIAFTFDLWDEFMGQTLPGKGTLRAEIQSILGAHTFPPDVAALRADLETVRDLIKDVGRFDAAIRSEIISVLEGAGFATTLKIRFRSSTNMEDSSAFSGAGLYNSYSGCIADDTDGDDAGPSHADPSQSKERGVFRAIRKVYASFYNENAFIERLRYGVNESQIGMAMLAHYSFLDAIEMANGVATFSIHHPAEGLRTVDAVLVTQLGAVSVANPTPGIQSETVNATFETIAADVSLTFIEASSLTSGDTPVMDWETDYPTLVSLLDAAARAYESHFLNPPFLDLDFEYKKTVNGGIVLKQIRPIPRPVSLPPPNLDD